MPYANEMRILYKKGILIEADPVSRRPDFLQIDLCIPEDSFGGMEMCLTLFIMVVTLHYRH